MPSHVAIRGSVSRLVSLLTDEASGNYDVVKDAGWGGGRTWELPQKRWVRTRLQDPSERNFNDGLGFRWDFPVKSSVFRNTLPSIYSAPSRGIRWMVAQPQFFHFIVCSTSDKVRKQFKQKITKCLNSLQSQVVDMLNNIYNTFDNRLERYDVYKVSGATMW